MTDTAVKSFVTPLFLESKAGPVFAIYYAPKSGDRERSTLIYVPPFAEEMNRARRMAALQARVLAASGVGVLLLDFFGTGDSAGDFRDARWQIWLDNISAAAEWLDRRRVPPSGLWGVRGGALFATAAAAGHPGRFKYLVLWQPVPDGKTLLNQFLRIRVAAARLSRELGETTEKLHAELAAGRPVEIAGYELSPELAQALGGIRMEESAPSPDTHVYWFEVAATAEERLMPAGARVVETWRRKAITVSARTVSGEQFWAVEEAAPAPDLIAETARAVEACLR